MLIRAAAVTLGFALFLTLFSLYALDAEFEASQFGWALLLALPVGVSVQRGGLGAARFSYPSATIGILVLWISAMAPPLVIGVVEKQLTLPFSDEALGVGRWLFFVWCLVFACVAGKPLAESTRIQARAVDIFAICLPIAAALSYQLVIGRFTNYQAGDASRAEDTQLVAAIGIGKNSLVWLPGFFLLVDNHARSTRLKWFSRAAGVTAFLLLFLSGGRSGIVMAVLLGFFCARSAGLELRMGRSIAVLAAVPICVLLVFTYRTELLDSGSQEASLPELTSIAVSSTGNMAAGSARSRALVNFSENIRVRIGIGVQFLAVVDNWLANGPALEGTFQDGLIRVVPSYFFPGKNELAERYSFEHALIRTGRFPDVDLSPAPWMQWLFELGLFGIVLGAAFYGLLVRVIEHRMVRTTSSYELAFWAAVVSVTYATEVTSDILIFVARDTGAVLCSAYVIAFGLRIFLGMQGIERKVETASAA